jgi:hypothetical protein
MASSKDPLGVALKRVTKLNGLKSSRLRKNYRPYRISSPCTSWQRILTACPPPIADSAATEMFETLLEWCTRLQTRCYARYKYISEHCSLTLSRPQVDDHVGVWLLDGIRKLPTFTFFIWLPYHLAQVLSEHWRPPCCCDHLA